MRPINYLSIYRVYGHDAFVLCARLTPGSRVKIIVPHIFFRILKHNYRFYDVHVDKDTQKNISCEEDSAIAAQVIQSVLLKYFAATEKDEAIIVKSINAAKEGDKMAVLYMEKKYSKCTISVYISLNNKGEFCPILQIMKKDGTLVQRKRMKPCIEMGAYGDIRFDGERVLIKPRKNAYYAKRKPIVIELPS